MTDTAHHADSDPAAIEREIERTQEEMSRTVDQIGDQLTPRNLLNALLDQADKNNVDARMLLDGARRNPLALAMIAGGAIWLASDADAKLPSLRSDKSENDSDLSGHHRDYIAHMERVAMLDGEDPASYQRRRDVARSNYFMVERGHEEDDASFRQRLDSVAEKFRERRHAWSRQAHDARDGMAKGSHEAVARSKSAYSSNPLAGGFAAAAVGALLGSLIPVSSAEETTLGGIGQKARDLATDQKDKMMGAVREQKDQFVSSVEAHAGRAETADG